MKYADAAENVKRLLDKQTLPNENPADVRVVEKMAKLFDAERDLTTKHTNDTKNKVGQASSLSEDDQDSISHKRAQGTQKIEQEESLRSLRSFAVNVRVLPYVNGGLFRDHFDIPTFSRRSRRISGAALHGENESEAERRTEWTKRGGAMIFFLPVMSVLSCWCGTLLWGF